MESKKFTQFGTFTVIIMSILLIVFAILLVIHGFSSDQETYLYAFLVLISLICLLTFYKLTIIVDNTSVSFKLGIGIFDKSYKIVDIESCEPVVDSFLNGWGIHKITGGWLYNVSGFRAIELTFKDADKIVRIGTNKGDEITELISGLLNSKQGSEENIPTRKSASKTKNTIIFLVLVGAIIAGFNYYNTLPIKINMKENQFEITGAYGLSVNYNDISAIDTIGQMPNIETRTNGFALGKVCKGYFRLTNIGNASLFTDFGVSPFVQLVLKNGRVIFFNLKDRQSTIETFKEIKAKAKLNSAK